MSKKPIPSGISASTSASPPAGGQRLIQTMLKQDKEQEKITLQLQMIMQGIQELKTKSDIIEQRTGNIEQRTENIEQRTENIEQRIEKTDEKVENIKQMMVKYEERFQKIEEEGKQREKKIGNIDSRLTAVEQEKGGMLRWEMERSEFYLRFQNIEEEKGENLAAVMIEILADALEITEEKMMDGIDEIYRVYTRYAMRNKLPREVHIRFTKKSIKTQILQVAREKTLKYKGKEVVVLKQIPRRVREMRREYQFLTKILLENEVNYRWLIPEGLMFTWQEQRHRIDSIEKAELFHAEFFGGRREEAEKEASLIEFQDEQLETEKEKGAIGGQIDSKEQREVRSTRAVRPKYKA